MYDKLININELAPKEFLSRKVYQNISFFFYIFHEVCMFSRSKLPHRTLHLIVISTLNIKNSLFDLTFDIFLAAY